MRRPPVALGDRSALSGDPRPLVVLVDSGVHAGHPHLAGVDLEACGLQWHGDEPEISAEGSDRTGHGTAVAAAMVRTAPAVRLLSIRVLDADLRTTRHHLAAAIGHAAERGAALVNLSLGSSAPEAASLLGSAVAAAVERGVTVVAAAHPRGGPLWPADLPEVFSATTRPEVLLSERRPVPGHPRRFRCHGWPRPVEGRPPGDNLFGPSFAAANLSAQILDLWVREGQLRDDWLAERLRAGA